MINQEGFANTFMKIQSFRNFVLKIALHPSLRCLASPGSLRITNPTGLLLLLPRVEKCSFLQQRLDIEAFIPLHNPKGVNSFVTSFGKSEIIQELSPFLFLSSVEKLLK